MLCMRFVTHARVASGEDKEAYKHRIEAEHVHHMVEVSNTHSGISDRPSTHMIQGGYDMMQGEYDVI